MGKLIPEVGKYYKHIEGYYAFIVTEVTEDQFMFKYVHPRDDDYTHTFRLSEFFEIPLTELEKALL
jgi:hypothetical protein